MAVVNRLVRSLFLGIAQLWSRIQRVTVVLAKFWQTLLTLKSLLKVGSSVLLPQILIFKYIFLGWLCLVRKRIFSPLALNSKFWSGSIACSWSVICCSNLRLTCLHIMQASFCDWFLRFSRDYISRLNVFIWGCFRSWESFQVLAG